MTSVLKALVQEVIFEHQTQNFYLDSFVQDKKNKDEMTYTEDELRNLITSWFGANPELDQKRPLPLKMKASVLRAKLKSRGLVLQKAITP